VRVVLYYDDAGAVPPFAGAGGHLAGQHFLLPTAAEAAHAIAVRRSSIAGAPPTKSAAARSSWKSSAGRRSVFSATAMCVCRFVLFDCLPDIRRLDVNAHASRPRSGHASSSRIAMASASRRRAFSRRARATQTAGTPTHLPTRMRPIERRASAFPRRGTRPSPRRPSRHSSRSPTSSSSLYRPRPARGTSSRPRRSPSCRRTRSS
jgi:hypothetical protein